MHPRQGPIAKIRSTNRASPKECVEFIDSNIKTFEIRNAHEMTDLKTLIEQYESSAIKTERFKALTILSQKNEQISFKELLLHAFSNEHRQLCKSRPHIDEFIEDENPMSWTE
jgi:hypothetical protein